MNYTQLSATISNYTENTEANFLAEIPVFVQQAEQRIYNSVQFPSLRKNMTGTVTSQNKYLSSPPDYLATYSLAIYPVGGGNYTYLLNKDVNFIRQCYPNPTDYGTPKYYALFGPTVSGSSITNELTFILGPTPDTAYTAELHYYYYPESIVQTPVATLGTITGGSSYTNGTYLNVSLTDGSGTGAVANIVVSGNAVTSVTLTQGGTGYVVGNTLSATAASLGGTGASFSVPVATVGNALGTSWLGDNFDSVLLYGSLVEAYTYMKGEADMMQLYNQKYMEALSLAKRLGDGMEREDAYRSGQYRQKVG
jgi:hypothetical protein